MFHPTIAYIECDEASDVRVAGPRVLYGGPRGVHGVHEIHELSQDPIDSQSE